MTKLLHGVIQGKTIELADDPSLPDGQHVEVALTVVPPQQPWGEGLRRCAGALANEWTADDDRILEAIHEDRKRDSRRDIAE